MRIPNLFQFLNYIVYFRTVIKSFHDLAKYLDNVSARSLIRYGGET